jgi:hypothetical protein
MLQLLDLAVCSCFIVTVVGTLVVALHCLRHIMRTIPERSSAFPQSLLIVIIVPGILPFMLFSPPASLVYDQANRFIRPANGSYLVRINGQVSASPTPIVGALRTIDNSAFQGHHSHPTARIAVRVERDGQALDLELGRDSEDPREYWVFYPTLLSTGQNAIARLRTEVFDEY